MKQKDPFRVPQEAIEKCKLEAPRAYACSVARGCELNCAALAPTFEIRMFSLVNCFEISL